MLSIPLASPDDEVMVKAPDGSWKMVQGGVLVDLPGSAPVAAPRPVIQPTAPPVGSRISVMDIIPPHTTVGPVQELRMRLEDYLRLAPTPGQRAQRIKEKIALLEKEEYAKKLEGVAAWKMSEVFALYVLMGQESVLSGVGIEDTIAKRKTEGQPALSVEDFQEITKLNKGIRN